MDHSEGFGPDGPKYAQTRRWLAGKGELHVYDLHVLQRDRLPLQEHPAEGDRSTTPPAGTTTRGDESAVAEEPPVGRKTLGERLTERLAQVSSGKTNSKYARKDLLKALLASQMIGQGSPGSSTARYSEAAGELANTGRYHARDVVFVSVNGQRGGRFAPLDAGGRPRGAYRNLVRAISAGATLIADASTSRSRPYNVGERELAHYLARNGYSELAAGVWVPTENAAVVGHPHRAEAARGLSPPQAITASHLARGVLFLKRRVGTAERGAATAVRILGERLATSAGESAKGRHAAAARVIGRASDELRTVEPDLARALRTIRVGPHIGVDPSTPKRSGIER